MKIRENIATILKLAKEARHMTLTEFADFLQISRSQLQALMNQTANPRIGTIEHIADRLGISVEVLIGTTFTGKLSAIITFILETIKLPEILPEQNRAVLTKLLIKFIRLLIKSEA